MSQLSKILFATAVISVLNLIITIINVYITFNH